MITAELAEALRGASSLGCEEFDPNDPDSGCPDCDDLLRAARALLPVVEAYATRKAAEAEAAGFERGRRTFQFAPEGDNHHNATLCPYCSPALRDLIAERDQAVAAVGRVRELANGLARDARTDRETVMWMVANIRRALDGAGE